MTRQHRSGYRHILTCTGGATAFAHNAISVYKLYHQHSDSTGVDGHKARQALSCGRSVVHVPDHGANHNSMITDNRQQAITDNQ